MADYPSLVEKAKNGSLAARWALYTDTVSRVYYTAEKLTGDRDAAVALTADSYILAFGNLERLEYADEFPVWLERLTVHYVYNTVYDAAYPGSRGLNNEELAELFRSFHNMTDEEITSLMGRSPKKALKKAETSPEEAGYLVPPESVTEIWSRIREEFRKERLAEAEREKPPELPDAAAGEDAVSDAAPRRPRRRRRAAIRSFAAALLVAAGIFIYFIVTGRVGGTKTTEYREILRGSNDEKVQQLASTLSLQLDGRVGEIYQIDDETYYVVIYLGTESAGGAIVKYDDKGGLRQVVTSGRSVLQGGKLSELVNDEYLQVYFTQANASDSRKNLTLDDIIKAAGTGEAMSDDNSYYIGGNTVSSLLDSALEEKEKLEEIVEDGADFSVVLRINCRNVDLSQNVTITLDSSISNAIGEAGELEIVLNDLNHRVNLSRQQLTNLCDTYGSVTLSLSSPGPRDYNIAFYTSSGHKISELFGDMTFTFPAESELSYVFATYDGGTETRGGVYDAEAGTITFPVHLSGSYEIIGGSRDIADAASMTEDEARAARFLVSLGFMDTDRYGNFDPSGPMTRGELVNVLGRMFLSTDERFTSGFSDVAPGDSEYDYISSGVAGAILSGYGDGTFHSDDAATRQDALTMCGNTIVFRLGAELPSDPELNYTDAGDIAGYAAGPAALCAGMGVIPDGGALRPRDVITRAEAALIFYNMYRLFYID